MTANLPTPMDVRLMNAAAALLAGAFVMLAVGHGIAWLLRHPVFSLGGIVVTGDVAHNSVATIRANVAPRLAGSYFTLDLANARRVFESVPWVRQAVVRREFPNRLRVSLQEHVPVAFWGLDSDSRMVNSFGEVFEANVGELNEDELPRLQGPEGQSALVWAMYQALRPQFEPLGLGVEQLVLSGRGGWQLALDNGAWVELGRGSAADVVPLVQRFVQTLTQVAARHGRRVDALASADLRHVDGYALRLRGVSTAEAVSRQEQGNR